MWTIRPLTDSKYRIFLTDVFETGPYEKTTAQGRLKLLIIELSQSQYRSLHWLKALPQQPAAEQKANRRSHVVIHKPSD